MFAEPEFWVAVAFVILMAVFAYFGIHRTVLTALTPTAPQPPASTASEKDGRPWWQRLLDRTGIDILVCPSCGRGRLARCGDVQPLDSSAPDGPLAWLRPNDTS